MSRVQPGRRIGEPLRETRPKKGPRYLGENNRATQLVWHLHSEGVELKGNGTVSANVQRLVLAALALHCNDKSETYVSQRRIAKALRLSSWSVSDAVKALQEQGLITELAAKKGTTTRWLVLPGIPLVTGAPLSVVDDDPENTGDEVPGAPLSVVVPFPSEVHRNWSESAQRVPGAPLYERERETENPPSDSEHIAQLLTQWPVDYQKLIEESAQQALELDNSKRMIKTTHLKAARKRQYQQLALETLGQPDQPRLQLEVGALRLGQILAAKLAGETYSWPTEYDLHR